MRVQNPYYQNPLLPPATLFIDVQDASTIHCMAQLLKSGRHVRFLGAFPREVCERLLMLEVNNDMIDEYFTAEEASITSDFAIFDIAIPAQSSFVKAIVLDIDRDSVRSERDWKLNGKYDRVLHDIVMTACALHEDNFQKPTLYVMTAPLHVDRDSWPSKNTHALEDILRQYTRDPDRGNPFEHIATIEVSGIHDVNSLSGYQSTGAPSGTKPALPLCTGDDVGNELYKMIIGPGMPLFAVAAGLDFPCTPVVDGQAYHAAEVPFRS